MARFLQDEHPDAAPADAAVSRRPRPAETVGPGRGQPGRERAEDAVEALLGWLRARLAEELAIPELQLDPERSPAELGADSVVLVGLVGELEDRLGRRVPIELLRDAATLRAAAEAVLAPAASDPVDVATWPEHRALRARLEALGGPLAVVPFLRTSDGAPGPRSAPAGRATVDFSTYDYLGLATHPAVLAAATEAVGRYGTSAGGSRLAGGQRPPHVALEHALAEFLGAAACVTFVSGHGTNVSVIGQLVGPEDLIVHDARVHDSALQGARLAGARRLAFPRGDLGALERLLAVERPRHRRVLVLVEGVYSADGDVVDLPAVVAIKRRHRALLMVDEAHSLGVLGETGRGVGEHLGVSRTDVDVWMGTLSKALASCGGFVAGSAELVELLRYTCSGFVFSVAMPPASAAAALAALEVLSREPERVATLASRARAFRARALSLGLVVGPAAGAGFVSVRVGDTAAALTAHARLLARGVHVLPMIPPAVEPGDARLRFFLSCRHAPADVIAAAEETSRALAPDPGRTPRAVPRPKPRRVLVTGGSGFIGRRVVARLLARGDLVRTFQRGAGDGLPPEVERARGDITDSGAVAAAAADVDDIVHLAGVSAWRDIAGPGMHHTVVAGARSVLGAAAARGAGLVVVSSAVTMGGTGRPIVCDEDAVPPEDARSLAYVAAKLEAEAACAAAARQGQRVMVVNPAEVYGPGDDELVTAGNLIDLSRGPVAFVCAGGTSVVHVDDVAEGIVSALDVGVSGTRYALGGENLTVAELARLVRSLAGRPPRTLEVSVGLLRRAAAAAARHGLPFPLEPAVVPYATRYWFLSSRRAIAELGFSPRGARDTLAPVVAWLAQCGRLP